METNKNYFFQAFFLLIISAGAFIAFKTILPKKLLEQTKLESKNVVIDSLLLDAIEEDSSAENNELVDEKDSLIKKVITYKANSKTGVKYTSENFENYKGYQHVIPFYEKLLQLETTKVGSVRIAYFGDSMNDRATITHEFFSNLKTQSYLKVKKPIRPCGVNGHVFFANDTINPTWVKYKASNYKYLTQLNNPTLFYGSSTNKEAKISYIIGKDTIYKKLNGENQLNTLKLADNLKSVKVNFIDAANVPIYGFNFDDGKGVHVDNFSNRGNSGLPISIFNVGMMQAFNNKLDYDLVVLHYGTNVLNYGS